MADAGNLLATGQADAVVVGAVDLSLDPFELVGFSRNGALARDEMRVFDARSSGFWPGEGGAFAVLMRADAAEAAGLPVLVELRGWGLSTDGMGGLTRPTSDGQVLAARRACDAAGVDPADLAFVEAHGTGTAVGDPIEIRALAALRAGASAPLPVGSIKANIGHAKAAAGLAGLVKATMALRAGLVPPHVSCVTPHPVFAEVDGCIAPAETAPLAEVSSLVGVSSFGFGGINVHVVLGARAAASARSVPVAPKPHDAELLLFTGEVETVAAQLHDLCDRAGALSLSEVTDTAAALAAERCTGPVRAALVAAPGADLRTQLLRLRAALLAGEVLAGGPINGFTGAPAKPPRLAYVFPGQAAPSRPGGGLWARCFPHAAALARRIPVLSGKDPVVTEIAQPAIAAASLAGAALLARLGLTADVAVGHSLGEIAALAWAGALRPEAAVDLAARRGAIMARDAQAGGAMLRVALPADEASDLAASFRAVVACENGPLDTVLAVPSSSIEKLAAHFRARGIEVARLAASHAFHSADMGPAGPALRAALSDEPWRALERPVVSTVTGDVLPDRADLVELLTAQLMSPVRFVGATARAAHRADLFVEVGPGQGLSRLLREQGFAALPIDAFGDSLIPLFSMLAELHVRGCDIDLSALFEARAVRPLTLERPVFLESACRATAAGSRFVLPSPAVVPLSGETAVAPDGEPVPDGPLPAVQAVVAAQMGLSVEQIGPDDRFLEAVTDQGVHHLLRDAVAPPLPVRCQR